MDNRKAESRSLIGSQSVGISQGPGLMITGCECCIPNENCQKQDLRSTLQSQVRFRPYGIFEAEGIPPLHVSKTEDIRLKSAVFDQIL